MNRIPPASDIAQDAPRPDGTDRPEIVAVYGPDIFFTTMLAVAAELEAAGVVVLMPFRRTVGAEHEGIMTPALEAVHRHKTNLADRVLVVTDRGSFLDERTRRHIDYALHTGVPIEFVPRAASA
ncbi:hypothetical protein ACWDUL_20935 [Nocardia niigatensis]